MPRVSLGMFGHPPLVAIVVVVTIVAEAVVVVVEVTMMPVIAAMAVQGSLLACPGGMSFPCQPAFRP
jgi:hypothetical protein